MRVAHGATAAGGVHLEFLIVGAGFAVFAVVLFLQKTAKPYVSVVMLLLGLALASGAFVLDG